jgi:hypothetical protein
MRWPQEWDDEPAKFWIYSGLVDAGGLACERLFDKWADLKWSETDLKNVDIAAQQLLDLSEHKGGTPRAMAAGFHDLAQHLLAPHTEAIESLAGKAASRRNWNGSDVTRSLLTSYPAYRHRVPLFDGDWYAGLCGLLDAFDRQQEAQAQRWLSLSRRLDRRYGS